MLTLDVACFVGGSYYFCVRILLKKKQEWCRERYRTNVIEGEVMKKTYN